MSIMYHVIFDFDGTMIHSNEIKKKAFFDVVDDNTANNVIASILEEGRIRFWDRYIILEKISFALNRDYNDLISKYNALTQKMLFKCEKRTGIDEFLQQCSGLKFINSATPLSQLKKIINEIFHIENFDLIMGDGAKRKIMNLSFLREKYSLVPENTIIIGDGQDDYDVAKHFGCKFFGFKGGSIEPTSQKLFDTYFEIIEEIENTK